MEYQYAGSAQHSSYSDASPLLVDTVPANAPRRRFAGVRAGAPAVVPSLLLCDFGHLADEVYKLEAAGVRALHLDVMDGHFVPNLSYGLPIVEAVRRLTELPIEAHLMISDPARYAEQFFSAGADAITFHVEAVNDPRALLEKLRSLGAVAGLAFNPATPISAIQDCLDVCDLIRGRAGGAVGGRWRSERRHDRPVRRSGCPVVCGGLSNFQPVRLLPKRRHLDAIGTDPFEETLRPCSRLY